MLYEQKKISKTQSKLHQIKTILQFINEINVLGIKKQILSTLKGNKRIFFDEYSMGTATNQL